jgi:hypothetical protein
MLDIFSNSKRPFFSMTQYLSLKKIDRKTYCDFIVRKFEENKRTIDDSTVNLFSIGLCRTLIIHRYFVTGCFPVEEKR